MDLGERTLTVAVWYPTDATATEFAYGSGKVTGRVAENAAVKSGAWPLIVFSHGFGGSGIGQIQMTEALAARGWIVAAPDHSDPVTTLRIDGQEDDDFNALRDYLKEHPFNRDDYAYRPLEVQAVLDYMLAAPEFNLAPGQVALAGHSLGGWSVMTIALEDDRVQATVLYSMGELNWLAGQRYFEADELARLTTPTLYFYGEDEKALNSRGAYAEFCYENSPTPTYLVEVPDGNHFTYNDRAIAPRLGGTPVQHELILRTTAAFLERHILGSDISIESTQAK